MARNLTENQQRFLDALFTTAEGDVARAKDQAGYADGTPVSFVVNSLSEEIMDLTRRYLASGSAKAAFQLVNIISDPSGLGTKERITAAKDVLDRAGFVKVDKVEFTGSSAVFVLPAKDGVSKQMPAYTDVLPKPPTKPGEVWYPAVRIAHTIPFGYELHPDDDKILLPIVKELELLEKAKLYLREYSSRNVADWLTKESGREISHAGLLKRVKQEKLRRYAAGTYRKYERLYKEAKATAEKLEKRIGGKQLCAPSNLRSTWDLTQEQRRKDKEIGRAGKASGV